MTLEHAMAVKNILTSLIEKKLPFRLSYKIAKLLTSLQEDAEFFRKKYSEILEKYAIPETVNANGFQAREGMEQEQSAAMAELFNCPTEDRGIRFSLEDLETISLTPAEVGILLPLIEE